MSNVVNLHGASRAGASETGPDFEPQRVLDLCTSALIYWGRDAVCEFANRASADWFGLDPEFIVGSSFEDLLQVLGLPSHRALAQAALRGEARSVVQALRHPNGERIGLMRYLPDIRQGTTIGFLLQVSVTPADLQLKERG